MTNREIYAQIQQILHSGRNAVLQQRFRGVSGRGETLSKEILPPDHAGFQAALAAGLPVVRSADGYTVVTEPFFPAERLIVLGGGHIALTLVDFAAKVGFAATVVDDRPGFANAYRFPAAAAVICESFAAVFDRLQITSGDYVVVVTRGHRHDRVCLEQIHRGAEPFYVGLIGSRRRTGALKVELIANGFDADRVSRTKTPIGLAIGAITPAEIAVSIMAELIAAKRLRGGQDGPPAAQISRSDIDMNVLQTLAAEKDIPKAIVTVIAAKGSVPRGPGAKMLVYPDNRILGSIGGGCSEAEVMDVARRIIGTRGFCVHAIDLTAEIAEEEGMVCGGTMSALIEDYMEENAS
ncbi:MAG: XdhC family protein [Gracilibacteraceae bacterium]|jgi:xanthine dehydrogenase accessory factor|nr:XdhC family protein [Gracilibacteraceae bacterium]